MKIEFNKFIPQQSHTHTMSRLQISLTLLAAALIVGCGAPEPPEINQDVAAEIAAEDEAIVDAESEL